MTKYCNVSVFIIHWPYWPAVCIINPRWLWWCISSWIRHHTAVHTPLPRHQCCHGDAINKCPGADEAPGCCFIFLSHGLPSITVFLSVQNTYNAELRGYGCAAMGCKARSSAKHRLKEVFVAWLRIVALSGRLSQGAPSHLPLFVH